jgi:hypothetical protein
MVRDGNGPGRRVKHQFRGLARLSKSHTHPARFISLGLKIPARLACGPSFSDSAQPVMQCSFLKSTEKYIFFEHLRLEI